MRLYPIVLILFASLSAPAADSPQDVIEHLATQLRRGDAAKTLALFDPAAQDFAGLKRNIEALSALPNTTATIAITGTKQSGDSIQFETDWSLQIYTVENGPLLDRSEHVTISLRKSGDEWRMISLAPVSVLEPPDTGIFRFVATLAADLGDKNESGAVAAFDKSMKQYGEIDNDIDALVTQNDLLCAIDVVSDRQTGDLHTLDLDWYFDIKSRTDGGPSEQRRRRVQLKVMKKNGKFRITGIEPLGVLSPELSRPL